MVEGLEVGPERRTWQGGRMMAFKRNSLWEKENHWVGGWEVSPKRGGEKGVKKQRTAEKMDRKLSVQTRGQECFSPGFTKRSDDFLQPSPGKMWKLLSAPVEAG
ncbi:hypothetical protein CRENBAI_024202 [Crenichthys baileyi]|uniref:Uncharacterized protein n=1 Tax=Crenichthys baileyi TaxID=28760 RepID=A0AAV9S755_9TELE